MVHSFPTRRSSDLVQRVHSHFYPRTIEFLPFPRLTTRQIRKLHKLAIEVSERSARAAMTVTDIYLESMEKVEKLTKAGFLGLCLAEGLEEIDREELIPANDPQIPLDFKLFVAEDPDLGLLARIALLATENDEFSAQDIENLLLPAEAPVRKQLAEGLRNYAADLQKTQHEVLAAMEEIDEIVAKGLSLSPAEHDTIRKRCHEFPLSITVERPRFAWNPERKVQARRTYRAGERFRA